MADLVAEVESTEWLTPHLVRVVFGGPELTAFGESEFTDAYLKAVFETPDGPVARRYSVRRWDAATGRLTIDFVVHGDEGVAGPWAAAAEPGDRILVAGPAGGYRPAEDADWYLMAGDESALPAITASLEQVPAGRRAIALLVCDSAADEVPVTSPGRLDVRWLHRSSAADPASLLPAAVTGLEFPAGKISAFVHGEAGEVREVRRHLLADRQVPRSALSASGYWRRTLTDEAWRQVKREWSAAQEADVPA